MVIQNNANVQTQGDRLIKVGCIMSNATLRDRRTQDENTTSTNHEDEEHGQNEDNIPNAIALESSLEFAQRYCYYLLDKYRKLIFIHSHHAAFFPMKALCILTLVISSPCLR